MVDSIHTSLTTTTFPLPLLVNGKDGKPHAVVMPFNENTLPGQPVGDKHGLVWDVSAQGALPPLSATPRSHDTHPSHPVIQWALNQPLGAWPNPLLDKAGANELVVLTCPAQCPSSSHVCFMQNHTCQGVLTEAGKVKLCLIGARMTDRQTDQAFMSTQAQAPTMALEH